MKRQFVSYPKSGRTWVRYGLTQLGVEQAIFFHHDGFEFNNGEKPPHNFSLEKRLEKYSNGYKIIYMERDPRDVMVSLFYQVTGRFKDFFDYKESISTFIRDDYFGAHNLRKFRDIWAEICNKGYAHRITYEDCHKDFSSELKLVTEYFGYDFSFKQIKQASKQSSFKNMKKMEQSNSFQFPWLRPRNNAPKVRKGEIGDYVNVLSAEDIMYLNHVFDIDK